MSKDKCHKYFGVSLSEITKREGSVIPNIICKLTNYLLKNGLDEEGIFRINGSTKTVEKLMNQFDKKGDADLSNIFDPSAIASLLKQYLRDLPDTLIPSGMTQSFVATQEAYLKDTKNLLADLRHLVGKLPAENYRTLKYLIAFLVLASKHHSASKMNSNALSTVFGPNIFKCGPGFAGLKEQGVTNCIVLQFINRYQQIFTTPDDNEITPDNPHFTLDGLKESLKKEKLRIKQDVPTQLSNKTNNLPKQPSNSMFIKNYPTESGDGTILRNLYSKENLNEVAADKYARHTTNDWPVEGGRAVPLLVGNKRRASLESETVVLSEIVLSEIDKVIMKYVFREPQPGDDFSDGDDKDSLRSVGIGEVKLQSRVPTPTNVRNNSNNNSLSPVKVKTTKHIVSHSDDDEEEDDDDDDDDSTIDFSGDDDDDVEEKNNGFSKTVIKCPPATIKTSNRVFSGKDHLPYKRDEGHTNIESVRFSKVGNGDDGDVSFHNNNSDPSQRTRHLKKKMQVIVQKLNVFEEEFERSYGRKFINSDLQNEPHIKLLRKELEKCRYQLENPERDDAEDHHHHHPHATSVKETFDSLTENLHARRIAAGRPEDPKLMSSQQLQEEKRSLQKALLKFEQMHGRPNNSTSKGIMMPLYDRYRAVKRLLSQNKKADSPSPDHHHHQHHRTGSGSRNESKEDDLNFSQMTLPQLTHELEKTQQQKKSLQFELQHFEKRFQQEHGRRVQKADQMVMSSEYREYINIKSKLKLLTVLIEKHQRQSNMHNAS